MIRTCIIIEDQPPAQRILQKYINDVNDLVLSHTFSSALEALSFLQNNKVDLIFLDIHLPKISGMDFLKTLKNPPQVILTTAFSEYALESYEYNVVDYLLKPFSFQRFVQAMTKCTNLWAKSSEKNSQNKVVFIKSGYDLIKVNITDIIYIKSDADYTEVVTENGMLLSSDTLKTWVEELGYQFCQVHKSYLINTSTLVKVSGNQIYLNEGHVVPIGRAFKANFVNRCLIKGT